MKKMLCLFLLLSILLTACGTTPIAPVTESTANTMETLPPPSEESTLPTEVYTSQSGVYVDFSAYTQGSVSLPSPIYTLPNGSNDQLPLSAPRALYPYAGSCLRNAYGYNQGYLYGLTDSSGTLITLPIYTDIYPLYEHEANASLPIWVVEKTEKSVQEWDGELYDSGERKLGLVAMDGSFVLDCIYSYISLYSDRIICGRYVDSNTVRPIVEAYDAEGNLRFSTENYSFDSELRSCYATYGEGLYILSFRDTSPDAQEYDTLSYFVSEDGRIQYGPYYSAMPFHEGIAAVSFSFDQCTYLRRDGTLFPETYTYADSFQNGLAMITNEQWNNGLIDTEGNMYIVPAGGIIRTTDGAFIVSDRSESSTLPTCCYDKDGTFLWEITEEWTDILSKDLFYHSDAYSTTVKSISTGKSLTLPVDAYVEYQPHSTDPYLVFYTHQWGEETLVHNIVTLDLEVFAKVKSQQMTLPEAVEVIGESYRGFSLRDGEKVTLYRSPNNPAGTFTIPKFSTATLFPDGTVSFTLENYTEFYDKDGNLFLRYTFDPMDD